MFLTFGVGLSQSYNTDIEVCKTKNLSDYETVTHRIDNELK